MHRDKKETVQRKLSSAREDLQNLLQGLAEEQWEAIVYSEGDEWRVSDLLRHLTNAEKGMTGLIEQVQKGGQGVPPDFDLKRWNARVVEKAKDKSPHELLAEMDSNRARLLHVMGSLEEGDWTRTGRHASLRIMSIEQILHLIADHERRHTEDIRQALSLSGNR